MSVYLSDLHVEALLDGVTWTDLAADVIASAGIAGQYGILSSGPLDRVAPAGVLTFSLRDNALSLGGREGYYTPGSAYCLAGFAQGCPVRLRLEYGGESYLKFRGRIASITPDRANQVTAVTITDYMDLAGAHELQLMQYTSDLPIEAIVPLILANMPIQPASTNYHAGQDRFPDVFDTLRAGTRAATEMTKVALSELGYIYICYGRGRDETLTVEGRYTRANLLDLALLEYPNEESGALLDESGEALLLEDGGRLLRNGDSFAATLNAYTYVTDFDPGRLLQESTDGLLLEDGGALLLDASLLASVENPYLEIGMEHGAQVYNRIAYTAYPRQVDATATTVLYALQSALPLAAGETKSNVLGRYRDPVGGAARVSGRDMVPPVATTDYLMNAAEDGSGTNLTASLSVTAAYGTEGVSYTLENTGAAPGYVTRLQARGRGVYIYDPITLLSEDTTSQAQRGVQALTLDLVYQKSIETASGFASLLLDQYTEPRLLVNWVRLIANGDAERMVLFLELEPGRRAHIAEAASGVDEDVFINGVAFQIVDKLIFYTLYVQSASFALGAYWELETPGRGELGVTTILGY